MIGGGKGSAPASPPLRQLPFCNALFPDRPRVKGPFPPPPGDHRAAIVVRSDPVEGEAALFPLAAAPVVPPFSGLNCSYSPALQLGFPAFSGGSGGWIGPCWGLLWSGCFSSALPPSPSAGAGCRYVGPPHHRRAWPVFSGPARRILPLFARPSPRLRKHIQPSSDGPQTASGLG